MSRTAQHLNGSVAEPGYERDLEYARDLEGLMGRYMRALLRRGGIDHEDLRTCTHCGAHVAFEEDDGDNGWAACSACGELA